MRGKFHSHAIAGAQPYKIPFHGAYRMGENLLLILQFHTIQGARQLFQDGCRYFAHGLVNTQGPLDVTATQCSKWAE
jgi:hypothetical protein